jgi:pyruvate-formate lyase-activating enzyme
MKHPGEIPFLVYADRDGNIFDLPGLRMSGRSGQVFHPVDPVDLIPLPEGSELFVIPGRMPVGWDDATDEMIVLEDMPDGSRGAPRAVAAFMAPAYTQTAMTAWRRDDSDSGAQVLPLFAYTAVGWWKGRFWAAGFRSDRDKRQDFNRFNRKRIRKKTLAGLKRHRDNRLVQHLGRCSLSYGCPAARNYFLERWEAPLPTSPVCNARCLGCLSLQPEEGPPSTQERITFVPRVSEVVEVAAGHLKKTGSGIVSFGQGCEGEPLMQGKLLEKAVRAIREKTDSGTINLNSNASRPDHVASLAQNGLDSMRISMNSVRKDYYDRYYRPSTYEFSHVTQSWNIMKEAGKHVSLNLFVMPGLTDEIEEIDRLSDLIERYGLDLIQLRNHNIDPDWYLDAIDYSHTGYRTGIRGMVNILKKRFPELRFGYFNPPLAGTS